MKYRYNLEDYLNKRHSTRNLSDDEFESAISELANQLEIIDFTTKYTDKQLISDWKNLLKFSSESNCINSTVRHGMKISEHFMDNFWNIKDTKGRSFSNQWTSKNLEKILRWNRKSHSTPYLSEIRRGIYFCTGMTKNTMYRPTIAKLIVEKYANNGTVLDPCAGWGGRMIGTVAAGSKYIGFEPNTKTFANLHRIIKFLGIENKVTIYNDGAENINKYTMPNVDLILTSPPYYNLEIYSDESTQSVKPNQTYEQWLNDFLGNVINLCISKGKKDVVSAWNVANFGKYKMIDDVAKLHSLVGFSQTDVFSVNSSKRQSNQNINKNAKSSDLTICYRKI